MQIMNAIVIISPKNELIVVQRLEIKVSSLRQLLKKV